MIDKLEIDEHEDEIYNLSGIGLENVSLVIEPDSMYFETETEFFPFKGIGDFEIGQNNLLYIKNEDNKMLIISKEQLLEVEQIINS